MQWLKYVERLYQRQDHRESENTQAKELPPSKEQEGTFWGMSAHDALAVDIVTRECGRKS
ncbi:hypothetical protein [Hahella ganghwensis]|uniref:hypothetical protein n=1 Tax=Hahella ganghwensis TaxID=286420 RepID=UPI00036C5DAA|nr:hypothetical protein [Hahella ganghwensis]